MEDLKQYGLFSVTNKINGDIWIGKAIYGDIRTTWAGIKRQNLFYCERSELNKQIHEFGIENFKVASKRHNYGDLLESGKFRVLNKQEENPFGVAGVYAIYDVVNLKVYVGAAESILKRVNTHLLYKLEDKVNSKFYKELKINRKNFHPIILEIVHNLDILGERELYWIR